MEVLDWIAGHNGRITETELDNILKKYGSVSGSGEDKILTTEENYKIKVTDIYNGIVY